MSKKIFTKTIILTLFLGWLSMRDVAQAQDCSDTCLPKEGDTAVVLKSNLYTQFSGSTFRVIIGDVHKRPNVLRVRVRLLSGEGRVLLTEDRDLEADEPLMYDYQKVPAGELIRVEVYAIDHNSSEELCFTCPRVTVERFDTHFNAIDSEVLGCALAEWPGERRVQP